MAFLHLNAMLKKENRLKRNEDFRLVYREGKFAVSRPVVVYYRRRNQDTTLRAGIVVSKKIGNSYIRSRHKRLLREALRPLIPRIKPGHDVVLVARKAIVGEDQANIRSTLENLLQKARLTNGRRAR